MNTNYMIHFLPFSGLISVIDILVTCGLDVIILLMF